MSDKIELPLGQFVMALAVPFIVGAAGATVALKVSQASTAQKVEAVIQRVTAIETRQEKFVDDMVDIKESLALIKGALGIPKK